MSSDRQIIVIQILKAIDYGNLSRGEIVRRLNRIIDMELKVPFDTEINQVKVELCRSLLHRLTGYIETDDMDIEKSKEAVVKRLIEHKKRLGR